jgi:uncharacterized protein (TIGR00661 family)
LPAHFFWDKDGAPESSFIHKDLTFHRINGPLFIEYFISCRMYTGTAGFESLCEAMYLGKPFLCVPSLNHFEQACNALDATRDGAGIWDDWFNLDKLMEFESTYNFDVKGFRKWANQAPAIILCHLK